VARIKRAVFLTAGTAAFLSGCAHRGASALPPLSPSSQTHAPLGAAAEAIPASVLEHPIIGEARRFDGADAPPGWLLMDGQALPVARYPRLFAIYGNGARDRASFTLVKPLQGYIIAAAGLYPNSTGALASLHRGADRNHGVSVASQLVHEAPLAFAAHAPATQIETWYPGTLATEAELAAQHHAATTTGSARSTPGG
jgi:microcystin-dependent protein